MHSRLSAIFGPKLSEERADDKALFIIMCICLKLSEGLMTEHFLLLGIVHLFDILPRHHPPA